MVVSECCNVPVQIEKHWRYGQRKVCSFCYQECKIIREKDKPVEDIESE